MRSHEIDYEIFGDDMQFVEIELDPQETVISEPGAMMMMDSGIDVDTLFGDGNDSGGFMGKLFGAGKRVLTGENLFMNTYTNLGNGKQKVAFAAPYPGKIIPIDLPSFDGKVICQKNAFLCAAKGVSINIEFRKKLGVGFFGGEGFIMQKLEGDGLAFLHAGGTITEKTLAAGQTLYVDTGCLVAMTKDVTYDIKFVGKAKTAMFGGEGLFYASLQGPGKVWVQSLPFSRLADKIISASKLSLSGGKDESKIGGFFGDN